MSKVNKQNKIVEAKLEQSWEFAKLIDVIKEVLTESTIEFIRDPNYEANATKKNEKISKSAEEQSDEESEEEKKKSDSDEESESDTESGSDEESKKSKKNKIVKSEDKNKNPSNEEKKSTGGIRILAFDDQQTLLIYVKLNAEEFSEFYVGTPYHKIGLDIAQFHKFTKTIDKESMMTISIDKDDQQYVVFELENESKDNTSKYKQKLLDYEDKGRKLPSKAEFEMAVVMDTSDFRKICTEMNQFSEYVEITCTSKEITFRCQGDSNAFIKTFKNSSSDSGVKITCYKIDGKSPSIVQAIYNLKHLVTFGKCVNLCSEMQLFLKNDYPLFINYSVGRLGKMLVGLVPVDEQSVDRNADYDEKHDNFYDSKKIIVKDEQ